MISINLSIAHNNIKKANILLTYYKLRSYTKDGSGVILKTKWEISNAAKVIGVSIPTFKDHLAWLINEGMVLNLVNSYRVVSQLKLDKKELYHNRRLKISEDDLFKMKVFEFRALIVNQWNLETIKDRHRKHKQVKQRLEKLNEGKKIIKKSIDLKDKVVIKEEVSKSELEKELEQYVNTIKISWKGEMIKIARCLNPTHTDFVTYNFTDGNIVEEPRAEYARGCVALSTQAKMSGMSKWTMQKYTKYLKKKNKIKQLYQIFVLDYYSPEMSLVMEELNATWNQQVPHTLSGKWIKMSYSTLYYLKTEFPLNFHIDFKDMKSGWTQTGRDYVVLYMTPLTQHLV